MALGGTFGSLIGGYALTNIQIDQIFLFFSALQAIQLLSCGLVEESSVGSEVSSEYSNSNGGSHSTNGRGLQEDDYSRTQNNTSADKSKNQTLRRKKSQKSGEQGPPTASKIQVPEIQGSFTIRLLHSLKMATFSLFRAFRQPIILR